VYKIFCKKLVYLSVSKSSITKSFCTKMSVIIFPL